MATQFRVRSADGTAVIRLYSLCEYEQDGGIYSDAGNGGEDLVRDAAEDAGVQLKDPDPETGYSYAGITAEAAEPADEDRLEAVKELVRGQFLAAAAVLELDGLSHDAALEAAGIRPGDYWLDTSTDYLLLYAWPAAAPLAARMVDGSCTAFEHTVRH